MLRYLHTERAELRRAAQNMCAPSAHLVWTANRVASRTREHDPTDGGILTNIFEVCSPLRAQCGRAFAQLLLRVVSARTVTTCVWSKWLLNGVVSAPRLWWMLIEFERSYGTQKTINTILKIKKVTPGVKLPVRWVVIMERRNQKCHPCSHPSGEKKQRKRRQKIPLVQVSPCIINFTLSVAPSIPDGYRYIFSFSQYY